MRRWIAAYPSSLRPLLPFLALAVVAACTSPEARVEEILRDPVALGLGGHAKVTCSGVFVSGFSAEESAHGTGYFFPPEDRASELRTEVDREQRSVTARLGGLERTAVAWGDQGCVLLPPGEPQPLFEPVTLTSRLPPADSQPWPLGDLLPEDPLEGSEIDRQGLAAAVEAAFAEPQGHTRAFAVVHRGRLVAERYAPGVDLHTQLESWSMGKTITAALVGVLVEEGAFAAEDPAPIPAWRERGDPRGAIRIVDLLQMSSGLAFSAPRDPGFSPEEGYPDHLLVYTGAMDVFRFSIHRSLERPPGSEGRYRNCDPLALGAIIRRTVEDRGEEYLSFPQRALFDRIGIRRQVLETDPYGNFLLTGFDYGTARNWVRLGLLLLQDGIFEGERILPPGWVDLLTTPAPAWKEPVYGGLVWLHRNDSWNLPPDAYSMAGGGGQRVFVIPSLDLVVVRMGHFRGSGPGTDALRRSLQLLIAALPEKTDEISDPSQP